MEMKPLLAIGLTLVFVAHQPAFAASTNSAAPEYPPAGTNEVAIARLDWSDARRDRQVPVKIYFPASSNGPFPVILFSHGLGGSREGYEYLGRHWAERGYVAVHLQHPGSDRSVWAGSPFSETMPAMRKAAANPENAVHRPLDANFALDQLEKLQAADPAWKGRLDLARVGMAGHSFGAFTTLAIAGQVFITPAGRELTFADPRVKAAVAMSAPVVMDQRRLERAYGAIKIPCLHLTGTEDSSPIGDTKPAQRRLPFDHIAGADQYLLTFKGGDHMIFGGASTRLKPEQEAFKRLICESSTAFWDAYLKSDPAAKAWLADGGCQNALGANGTWEKKLAAGRK
jgi:predicted dienelactone hydrolase